MRECKRRMGLGSNMRYERDVKVYKVEMILIYHLYPIIIGGTKRKVFGEHIQEMVRKNIAVLRATGNHT